MKVRVVLLIVALLLTACSEEILHDLSEREANRLISRLSQTGINAQKSIQADGLWTITVDRPDMMKALTFLESSRITQPKQVERQKGSVISSREEQRFVYERALSEEIERTLSTVDGVLEARVHLNLAPRDPIFSHLIDEKTSQSGSALLITGNSFALKREDVAAIVSGASGVDATRVTVLLSSPVDSEAVPAHEGGIENESAIPQTVDKEAKSQILSTSQINLIPSPHALAIIAVVLLALGVAVTKFLKQRGKDLEVNNIAQLLK